MGNMRTMGVLVIWVMAALGDASRRRLHSWVLGEKSTGLAKKPKPLWPRSSSRAIIAGRHVSSTSSEAEDDDDTVTSAPGTLTEEHAWLAVATQPQAAFSSSAAVPAVGAATHEESPPGEAMMALPDVASRDAAEARTANVGEEELTLAHAQFDALPRAVRQSLGGLISVLVQMLASFGRESSRGEPGGSEQNWSAVSDLLEQHLQRAATYMPLEGVMAMVVHMLEDHLTAEEMEAAVRLMHRRCVGVLPQMSTLSGSRAPATPPVPGPNPWMALVEATATDEEAADEETAFCAAHPAITVRTAEAEPSSSAGPAASDRPAALLRQVGPDAGPPFLEQPRQPVLSILQDCIPTLELEGLTSLGRARALMQQI